MTFGEAHTPSVHTRRPTAFPFWPRSDGLLHGLQTTHNVMSSPWAGSRRSRLAAGMRAGLAHVPARPLALQKCMERAAGVIVSKSWSPHMGGAARLQTIKLSLR